MYKFTPDDFTEQCIEIIKAHDTTELERMLRDYGKTAFERNTIMHFACKIGCIDSFHFLLKEGFRPDITDIEWTSTGKNKHQRDIFEYAVNKFSRLPFHTRSYNSIRHACKRQKASIVEQIIRQAMTRCRKNNTVEDLAKFFPQFINLATNYNNHAVLEMLFDFIDEHSDLHTAITGALNKENHKHLSNYVNNVTMHIAIDILPPLNQRF